MLPKNSKQIISSFRNSRRSVLIGSQEEVKVEKKSVHIPPKNQRSKSNSPYQSFIVKFSNLEENIDNFKTRDLVYYFREIAELNGYKYVISNIKKDMGIMKR